MTTTIFLAHCNSEPMCVDEVPTALSWKGIVPGQTKRNEVDNILGTPYDSGERSNKLYSAVYESEEHGRSAPHEVFFDKNGCSLLISEFRGENAPALLGLVQQYGEPDAVRLGGAEYRNARTFIYAEKGIAFSGDFSQEPESAFLFRVMYFVPTTTESFLEKWSESLFLGDDFSPHPDWGLHFSD